MTKESTEKHEFQAEVKQILDIVIHSLYTDKEIFVRELVSNASDALEKFRHFQLTEKGIFDDRLDLEINITTDDAAGTITIQDFGVGMTREELVENLGTIAHSGSKAFLKALQKGTEPNSQLIGQFGVGFYSSFMVAREVMVYTHSWKPDGEHLLWSSGGGDFKIETVEGQRRGCKIVLKLKEEEKDFAKAERLRQILTRYSSFVQFPIHLNGDRINALQAIWLRNKNEIKEEEYAEFYKFNANAFEEPRLRFHFNADAPLAINALLFVPRDNVEALGLFRNEISVSLYCRNVLIDDKPKGLLPEWFRFLRGVVDSADFPLNISRETMQDSALMKKLNRVLTRRFLKFLETEAGKRPDRYEEFYRNFGIYLKEGITTDFTYREPLAKLLRYESSLTEEGKTTSFSDYVSRMKADQKDIYFIQGPNRKSVEAGPYTEAFKARNLEVLYLYDPVDEFVMSHLREFDGKRLTSADQADIELEETPLPHGESLSKSEENELCEWIGKRLGERVAKVSGSKRLIDNPALVLNNDKMLSPGMRRVMKAMHQEVSDSPRVNLEINSSHQLIRNLAALKDKDPDLAELVTEQIFDNAMVAAGFNENPRGMVNRVYEILERVTKG